jgi:hypothetical protein
MSKTKARLRTAPRAPKDPLRVIPGIGPSLARDLHDLGIHTVAALKGRDPEEMYRQLIGLRGTYQDRCVLYVFRCAVYYGSTKRHRPERLLWWNWSDKGLGKFPPR